MCQFFKERNGELGRVRDEVSGSGRKYYFDYLNARDDGDSLVASRDEVFRLRERG